LKELTVPCIDDIFYFLRKVRGDGGSPQVLDWSKEYSAIATDLFNSTPSLVLVRFKKRSNGSVPYDYSVEAIRNNQGQVISLVWRPDLTI
jgi:hypothetical protein